MEFSANERSQSLHTLVKDTLGALLAHIKLKADNYDLNHNKLEAASQSLPKEEDLKPE